MTLHTLPAGATTALVSFEGWTYLAYGKSGPDGPNGEKRSEALVVERWPDGVPERADRIYSDTDVLTYGFPSMAVVSRRVLCVYRRDKTANGQPTEGEVVGVDLSIGQKTSWAVQCEGSDPCAITPDGKVGVMSRQPYRILESDWPNRPEHTARNGAPTGIARHGPDGWVTWDEAQDVAPPDFQRIVLAEGGAAVGVTRNDRVVAAIASVTGILLDGAAYKRPCMARQGNGMYVVATHVEASGGPVRVVVAADVMATDLRSVVTPEPGPDPVNPPAAMINAYSALNRPRAHHAAFFTHGAFGSQGQLVGNTALCIGGSGTTLEDELDLAVSLKHAIICPPDPIVMTRQHNGDYKWYGFVVAYFIHADDLADAEAQVVTAQARMGSGELGEQPLYVFIDKPSGHPEGWTPARPAWFDERIWPVVMWNVEQGETKDAARARLFPHARMVAAYGRPIALSVGTYDRDWGAVGVAGALIAVDLAAEIGADDHLEIIGYFYFSDYRGGGMQDHPEIRFRALALTRTIHDRPARLGGWVPEGKTLLEQVEGLFGQDVPVVEVSPKLKADIIACVKAATGHPTPGPGPGPGPPPGGPIDVAPFIVDRQDVVEAVRADYPDLKGGEICDQTAHRLNRIHSLTGDRIVFGRKARDADGGRPNDDVIAIRRDYTDVAKKAMVDVLINAHPGDPNEPNKPIDVPTWSVIPPHEEPGNGFWRPPVNPDLDGGS